MLTKRIIACLDVDAGRVVKGVQFTSLRDAGDPAELALAHSCPEPTKSFCWISRPHMSSALLCWTSSAAPPASLFIPFTVGGGIRSLDDAAAVFDAGADKITVNSAALADPALITRIAHRYGSQAVIVAIDALRIANGNGSSFGVKSDRRPARPDATPWSGRRRRKATAQAKSC